MSRQISQRLNVFSLIAVLSEGFIMFIYKKNVSLRLWQGFGSSVSKHPVKDHIPLYNTRNHNNLIKQRQEIIHLNILVPPFTFSVKSDLMNR